MLPGRGEVTDAPPAGRWCTRVTVNTMLTDLSRAQQLAHPDAEVRRDLNVDHVGVGRGPPTRVAQVVGSDRQAGCAAEARTGSVSSAAVHRLWH